MHHPTFGLTTLTLLDTQYAALYALHSAHEVTSLRESHHALILTVHFDLDTGRKLHHLNYKPLRLRIFDSKDQV
jgi:hypothetical protein